VFGGVCGNALKESGSLAIAWSSKTGMRGLVATSFIPAGEVIGQYLGRLELFGAPSKSGPANYGYQMRLKTKTTGNKHVGIDALDEGGVLRLMNHSCNPGAKFHEVQTGDRLAVVAVTVRPIVAGEDFTVPYGNKLWFVCRCGWIGCQHRDIQHLPDVHYAQSQRA
jgi:SET domain-containing protein